MRVKHIHENVLGFVTYPYLTFHLEWEYDNEIS